MVNRVFDAADRCI